MALFLMLLLGHLLGDFVFQPGRLVVAKRHGHAGIILHTGILTALTTLVLLGDIGRLWPAAALAGLAHLGIEHLSVRARKLMEANGLALFLLDQALHVVSLVIIAAAFGPAEPMISVWTVSLTMLAAACGMIAVAFAGSILAFEVRVAFLGDGADGPAGPILRLDLERVFGFAERGAALGVALGSGAPALGILVFVPRLVFALIGPMPDRARQMSEAFVGLAICSTVWLMVVAAATVRI